MVLQLFNFSPIMKLSKSCADTPYRRFPSKTVPGQSLKPAELLKRHLAGTLPDIDFSSRAGYTHDENGVQIDEDLSGLELHELHDLAERARSVLAAKQKQEQAAKQRLYEESVIARYKQTLPPASPASDKGASVGGPRPKGPVTGSPPASRDPVAGIEPDA